MVDPLGEYWCWGYSSWWWVLGQQELGPNLNRDAAEQERRRKKRQRYFEGPGPGKKGLV